MRFGLNRLAVTALLAFGLGAGSIAPASANVAGVAGAFAPTASTQNAAVTDVQYRGDRDRRWDRRHDRRWDRRGPPPRRHYNRGPSVEFHFGTAPRYVRPAPPRYVRPAPPVRAGNAHVRWCQSQYRSYRAYDNTFQPYNGPRRQCRSPYG